MKQLKNCIKLNCQVKIYVPSTINIDQSFDCSGWVDKALVLLSNEFGGATSSAALGAWINRSGNLTRESVHLVFAYATQEKLEKSIQSVYELCLEMKIALRQEAIALEVNGEMYLI